MFVRVILCIKCTTKFRFYQIIDEDERKTTTTNNIERPRKELKSRKMPTTKQGMHLKRRKIIYKKGSGKRLRITEFMALVCVTLDTWGKAVCSIMSFTNKPE